MCQLLSAYMSNLLSRKYNKNDFGLHRDDGLAVLKNKSGPQLEQIKKNIQKIFKEHRSDINKQCNMKIVNCLDVILDLSGGTYKPYAKPNNKKASTSCHPANSTIHRINVINPTPQ